jgi:EmrB/QacA subfamily drug resistance transporter
MRALRNRRDPRVFPPGRPPSRGAARAHAMAGDRGVAGAFSALLVAVLGFSLLQTMVAPALPALQRDLSTTTTGVSWVLSAFLLTASVATPVVGKLGDMFGKRRLLLASLAVSALGTLVAALSDSIGLLIVARAIQGIAAGAFPLGFGIVRDEFPPERVPTAIGLISATLGIGGGIGLPLAGVIVDRLGWHWIFWLGLVLALVAIAAVWAFVRESPVRSPGRVDWTGAALVSGGLVALLLAISEGRGWGWGSPRILALLAAAVVLLGALVAVETRVRQPLIDMRLLRRRAVLTPNIAALIIGFGMFGAFTLLPLFVETPARFGYGFGASVTQAGLFLLPAAAMMVMASPLAGRIGARGGYKALLALGSLFGAASFVLLAVARDERWMVYLSSAVLGVGIGLAYATLANLVVEAVDQRQTGEATGVNTIMRTIGGSLGA